MEKTSITEIITITIFIISYILIFSGKIERTIAALLGLLVMIGFGYALHFMNFEKMLSHVDWEVIILLFGMMTYVGLMAKTGFFKYLGLQAIHLSREKIWLTFFYLSIVTTLISMIIDNVSTILIIIPLTMELSNMLKLNPIPLLLGETVLSNIGGVGTLIGDPPNIMIGLASGFTFNDFIITLALPVFITLMLSIIYSRILYKAWFKQSNINIKDVLSTEPKTYITDPKKMKLYLIILFGMIVFFATESYTKIPPSFIALSGGTLALLISADEPREVFKLVEWSTLVFFVALFALVGGLYEAGVLQSLADWILTLSSNMMVLALIILWISGILSSIVDNIPITAALIPVIAILSNSYHSDIFWWSLALGVGLGGNITPIGSSAGVITTSVSKRYGYDISLKDWFRFGTIIGFISLFVASLFLFFMW